MRPESSTTPGLMLAAREHATARITDREARSSAPGSPARAASPAPRPTEARRGCPPRPRTVPRSSGGRSGEVIVVRVATEPAGHDAEPSLPEQLAPTKDDWDAHERLNRASVRRQSSIPNFCDPRSSRRGTSGAGGPGAGSLRRRSCLGLESLVHMQMSANRPWLSDPRLEYLYVGAGAMSFIGTFLFSVALAKLAHTSEPLPRVLLVATVTAAGVAFWFAGFLASVLSLARIHVGRDSRGPRSMLWIVGRGAVVMSAPSSVAWFVLERITPETSSPSWSTFLDRMNASFVSSIGVLVPFVLIRYLVGRGLKPRG